MPNVTDLILFFCGQTGPSENPAAAEQAERREGSERLSGEYRKEDKTGLGADRRT